MDFFDNQLSLKVARRASRLYPSYFSQRLSSPVFVVGFNNSGKSSAVRFLERIGGICFYPGEGNAELWFRGHFPWIDSAVSVAPIWTAPDEFIRSVKDFCGSSFMQARAQLGAYQWLKGSSNIVNDSGMLAAIAPDIVGEFPDGRFIHFIRDGRLASYITARLEWSRIIRSPAKYIEFHCPLRFSDVLRKMAEYWVWTIERMDNLSKDRPGSVLELRYEDWWSNSEPMVQRVSQFMKLPMPELMPTGEPKADLTQRLLAEMSEGECIMLHEILGPTMRRKGYTVSDPMFLSSKYL